MASQVLSSASKQVFGSDGVEIQDWYLLSDLYDRQLRFNVHQDWDEIAAELNGHRDSSWHIQVWYETASQAEHERIRFGIPSLDRGCPCPVEVEGMSCVTVGGKLRVLRAEDGSLQSLKVTEARIQPVVVPSRRIPAEARPSALTQPVSKILSEVTFHVASRHIFVEL